VHAFNYLIDSHSLFQYRRCSTKIAVEAQHGLIAQVLKDVIFSMRPSKSANSADMTRLGEIADTAMSIG
jgi:COP9 signalosome complex subunit 5